jgi:hypothetical protein
MLRASLGKFVHTVKRAGTYERKSHHKNYTKSLYMSGLVPYSYEGGKVKEGGSVT